MWRELGVDRPAPEPAALVRAAGDAVAGWIAAGGALVPEEPETVLVPLTRPRTPRGEAAAAGPSFPETPETARLDADGAMKARVDNDGGEADAPVKAGSAALLDAESRAGEGT